MPFSLITSAAFGSLDNNNATTLPVTTTGANLLIGGVHSYAGTDDLIDSKSNAWTGLTQKGGGAERARLYYCVGGTVGTLHTFTSAGTNRYPTVTVSAWSGSATSSPFDVQNGAVAAQPGSVTPSEDNELVVTIFTFGASATATVDSPFTITDQVNFSTNFHMGGAMAYSIQTTATARNPTWTGAGGLVSAIATFKATAAGVVLKSFVQHNQAVQRAASW